MKLKETSTSESLQQVHYVSAAEVFRQRIPQDGIHLCIGIGCTIVDDASLLLRLHNTFGLVGSRTIIVDPQETPQAKHVIGQRQYITGQGNVSLHREQIQLLRESGVSLAQDEYAGTAYGCFRMPESFAGRISGISDHNTLAYLIRGSLGASLQTSGNIRLFSYGLTQYRNMLMPGGVLYFQCREAPYFIHYKTEKIIPYTRLMRNAGFSRVDSYTVDDVWDMPFPMKAMAAFSGSQEHSDAAGYLLQRDIANLVTDGNLVIRPSEGRFHHDCSHLLIAYA